MATAGDGGSSEVGLIVVLWFAGVVVPGGVMEVENDCRGVRGVGELDESCEKGESEVGGVGIKKSSLKCCSEKGKERSFPGMKGHCAGSCWMSERLEGSDVVVELTVSAEGSQKGVTLLSPGKGSEMTASIPYSSRSTSSSSSSKSPSSPFSASGGGFVCIRL